mmetsp:Transcript_23168/g.75374  ORF Transcript_23168/g.75374 Transcript_23168/m.75374 type:complete len:280 (+) Transcript_23168:1130-1969(+)
MRVAAQRGGCEGPGKDHDVSQHDCPPQPYHRVLLRVREGEGVRSWGPASSAHVGAPDVPRVRPRHGQGPAAAAGRQDARRWPPPAVGVPDVEPEHRDCAEDRPLVQRPPARPSCGEHDAPRAAPARPVQDGRHRLSRPRVAAVRGEQGGERARAGGGQVPHDRAGPPCHALLRRAGVGGRSRHCQLSRDLHPLRPYRLHSRSPSGYLRSPPCPRAGALPWLHGEHGSSLDPVVRGGQMDCASRACKLLQREACSHARVLPGPFPSALLPVRWQRGERLQ